MEDMLEELLEMPEEERPQCQEPGCEHSGYPCYFEGQSDMPDNYYCGEHSITNGFCGGCGLYYDGTAEFDYNKGYCDNCKAEFDSDNYDGEDDDDY